MTLEQLKSDDMINDRKYQQQSMQNYQPGQIYNAYDMTNYGKNLQAQAEPNFNPYDEINDKINDKITKLESQIAMVKERIARNERALSAKSYEDVNNKLATLEMKKINSQDPTMLWRWQNQRQDTIKENANIKSNEAAKFANTVDMWVNTRPAPTTEGIMQQISNINSAIRDGKNADADVSALVAKKSELENLVYGGEVGTEAEATKADVDTIIKTAKTSDEISSFINERSQKLTPAQKSQLKVRLDELRKSEAAKAKAAAMKKTRRNLFGD